VNTLDRGRLFELYVISGQFQFAPAGFIEEFCTQADYAKWRKSNSFLGLSCLGKPH